MPGGILEKSTTKGLAKFTPVKSSSDHIPPGLGEPFKAANRLVAVGAMEKQIDKAPF